MKNLSLTYLILVSIVFISCAAQNSQGISKIGSDGKTKAKEVKIPPTQEELIVLKIEETLNSRANNFDRSTPLFYSQRSYEYAWFNRTGFNNSNVNNLLNILSNSEKEGLNPEDYNLSTINQRLKTINYSDINDISELDILLTNSIIIYAKHILYGNPNIGKFNFEKPIIEPDINIPLVLNNALLNNQITESIENLKPISPVYRSLINSLQRYTEIQKKGGWPYIREGKKLKLGSVDPRVAILRRRLAITGDLKLKSKNNEVDIEGLDENGANVNDKFDVEVENAVKKFQSRHNLLSDGIVGKSTIEALNIPVEEKINHIKTNLNLWRKLPNNLGDNRFVLVNIPFYKLYAFENNRPVEEMKVIVGKRNWNTPIFSDEITYLEVNPYWNVPKSILAEDIIPKAKEDPNYIKQNNLEILDGWGSNNIEDETTNNEIDMGPKPDKNYVNWNEVNPDDWPYRLRQKPGPGNPLGRLKFMFPNKHNVYLHDTPLKKYFNRTSRNLSHGCIRVEKPLELADFLLYKNPYWSSEQIEYQIISGVNKTVSLNIPIPVHIMYFTVWAQGEDTHFTEDIYNIF